MISHSGKVCGMKSKTLCYSIGTIDTASSFAMFILSVAMLSHPENFIKNYDQVKNDEKIRFFLVNEIGENGIELLIGSLSTCIASLCLIRGVNKNATSLILPWIIISCVDLCVVFMAFILRLTSKSEPVSTFKIVAVLLYCMVVIFFLYNVFMYYTSVKRQKKLARIAVQGDGIMVQTESGFVLKEIEAPPPSYSPPEGGIVNKAMVYSDNVQDKTKDGKNEPEDW